MKTNYSLTATICSLLLAFLLWGCGGGGAGSPGSTGSQDTGVILDATITPFYQSTSACTNVNGLITCNATYSVDVVQDQCPSATGTTFPEYFADHEALVTINASLINQNATIQPATLTVEYFTIQYISSADSIGAPPVELDTVYQTIVITPPTPAALVTPTPTLPVPPTVTQAEVVFFDLLRKQQYLSAVGGPFSTHLVNNYTAIYTFFGKNDHGDNFTFTAQTNFQVGDFNYCGITTPPL